MRIGVGGQKISVALGLQVTSLKLLYYTQQRRSRRTSIHFGRCFPANVREPRPDMRPGTSVLAVRSVMLNASQFEITHPCVFSSRHV